VAVVVRLYDSGRYEPALNLVHKAREQGLIQQGLLYVLQGNLAGKLN
jgi:hypothetical protein